MTPRHALRATSIGLAVVAFWLLAAGPAVATDCQEPWDCFGSSAAGLAALLGLLSFSLNFVPIVGDAKGILEAIIGRDVLTGQRLSAADRLLGVVTVIPGLDVLRLTRGADGLTGLRGLDVPPIRPHLPPVRPDVPPVRPDVPPVRPDGPPRDLVPGTPAHREARWQAYQERGGTWSRERWDRQYDINMEQARSANEAVTSFREELGLPREMQEVTVSVGDTTRRLDVADVDNAVGYEIKSGDYTTHTPDIRSELERDAILVDQGWDITWVFHGRASEPLLQSLAEAGINVRHVGGG